MGVKMHIGWGVERERERRREQTPLVFSDLFYEK
jgi:hypothetical protein